MREILFFSICLGKGAKGKFCFGGVLYFFLVVVMEQKHIFLSALGVGVGVGVGLGLSSGQAVGKWVGGNGSSDEITGQNIEQELIRQLLDGKNSNVTFAEFPYYLR